MKNVNVEEVKEEKVKREESKIGWKVVEVERCKKNRMTFIEPL